VSKQSVILDIVFHRVIFAIVFLLYIAVVIVDYIVDIMPTPWGMYLFVPVVIFGLIGYLVDEAR